jgi:hypothetical protein
MKHIVISAQMGAASNLIKNLVLLSPDVYWPTDVPRMELVMAQYNKNLKIDKTNWIDAELRLNNQLAHNCFLMEVDYFKNQQLLTFPKPGVFINHSLFWDLPANLIEQQKYIQVIFVSPRTQFGLEWQMRAIYEKKCLIKNDTEFHDFCFAPEEKDKKVQQYIDQFGTEEYLRYNIWNARQILLDQQHIIFNYATTNKLPVLYLEDLLLGSDQLLHKNLQDIFNINLPLNQVTTVLSTWRQLHWDVTQTFDWLYSIDNMKNIKEL